MASEHTIKSYDDELQRLNNTIIEMGGLAETQIAAATEALFTHPREKRTEDYITGRFG